MCIRDSLSTPGTVFEIGAAPVRIDILTHIDGVAFEDAWPERMKARFGGLATAVLSRST